MVKLLLSQKALSTNIVFFLSELFFSIIEMIKSVLNSQKGFMLVENQRKNIVITK
jgi:hypothetical protein